MAGRMDFERINGGERKNLSGGRMNFDNLKKKFSFEYPENLPSIEQVKQETSNSSYTPESPNKNISISDRVLGAGLSVTKGSIGTVKSIPDLVSFAGNTVSKGKFENTSAGKATRWVSDFFNEAMDIAQDIKPEKIQELEAKKIIGRDENGNWSVNAPNVAQATNAILESIPQIPAYLAGGKGVIAIGGKVGQKLQFLADKYKTIGNIFNFVGKNAQPLSQGVVNAPIIASQTASDVYGDVYKTLVDQGIPQEEAKEIAARQGATAGSQIMPIAGVTGMGLGFAQKNTGKVTSRSLKGFAKETVSEAPEEYAQNIVENRNVAQFDTTRDPSLLNPDALNAGALGAITGGAMGSIVGALSKEEKKGEIIKKETVEDTYKRSQENNVNFNDVVDASFEQKTTPQEALDMLILQKSKETETNQEKPLYGIKKAEEKARIEGAKTTLALQEGKKEDLSGSGIEQKFKQLDDKLTQKNNEIETLIKNSQNKETADPNYAERKQALEKERQSIMSEMDALFPEFQKTQNKVKEAEIVEAPEIKKDEKVKISTIENKKETSQDVVFPIKRVEKAYQHMHLSPGNTAKSEEASLNNEVSNIEKEIKKYNPEISDEELNSIKSSYRKNYIQNRESVWRSAENVVSSAVAGRNKFNKKQADKRGSSYDNSASRFDEWNAKEKESIFEKTGVNKGKEIDRKKENEKKLSKENDAKKKKIEYFVSLKKGDKIKLNGGNDVTVVKKNKTSIVTENGTVWTAKELYGIDHKELQEAYKKKTVVSKTKTPKEIKPIKNVISSNKKTLVSKNIEMPSFSYDKDIINEAKKYPTEEEFLKAQANNYVENIKNTINKFLKDKLNENDFYVKEIDIVGSTARNKENPNDIDVALTILDKKTGKKLNSMFDFPVKSKLAKDAFDINTELEELLSDLLVDKKRKAQALLYGLQKERPNMSLEDYFYKKIKTKSQLSDIYKQAQEELKAPKTEYTNKSLIEEAKKYKSEEEFLKGLGKTVYHGGVKLADLDGKKYAWFSTSQEVAGVNAMPAYKWFQRTNNIDVYNRGKARIAEMEKLIDEAGIERANVQLQKPFVVDAEGANYSEIKTPKELKKYTDLKEVDTDIIADWAKKNGYDGVIIKNVDEGKGATEIADTIAVFDRSKIKTKSQLSAIYKQAQEELKASKKTGIPKKESPNKSLIEEAKKYKSAEEFINSNIYYHGTNKKFNEFGKSTSAELGRGYYLTPDKYSALKFAHGKSYTRGGEQNIITAVPIYKKPLILGEGVDGKKALDLWEKSSVMNPNGSQIEKIAKNGGYDAVIRKGHGEGDEIMVFDKKNIRIIENITPNEGFINDTKSRSQLSAIYKQAQEELKAPKTEYTNKSLIEEAKKYKSADEFLKAQGTPMYHGSTVENLNELKLPKNTGKAGENQIKGIYLTPDYQTASYYGRINGIQVFSPQEVYTKGNILKVNDFTELEIKLGLKDLSEGSKAKIPNLLKEKGYDGVFLKRGGEANEMIITNPNAIKTKSQLSVIYKQAQEELKAPKTEYTNKSLIEEAKKYKSAEEFMKSQGAFIIEYKDTNTKDSFYKAYKYLTETEQGKSVVDFTQKSIKEIADKDGYINIYRAGLKTDVKGGWTTDLSATSPFDNYILSVAKVKADDVLFWDDVFTKNSLDGYSESEIILKNIPKQIKSIEAKNILAKYENLPEYKGKSMTAFNKAMDDIKKQLSYKQIKTKSQLSAIYKQAHEGISIPSLFDEVQSAFLGNIERVSNLSDKELLESKEAEALKRIIESFKDKELTPELASSLVFNTLEKVLNPDAEGNASSNAFYKNFMIHVGNLKGMTYDEALGILRHETFHNIAAILKGEKFDSVLLNWYRGLSESKKIGLFKTSLNDTEEQKQDRYNQYKDHYEKYLSSEKEIEFYMANEAFAHAIQFDGLNTPTMARKIINAVKDLITRILRLLRVQYANKENAESKYRYRKIESMVSDFFNPKGIVNISEENSAKFKEARERLNNLIFDKHKNNFAQYQKEMSMPSLSVKKNELQEHDSRLIDPKHREEYEKTLQEVADLIVQEKEYIQYQKQQSIFDFGWDDETESNYEKFVSLAKTYKKQASKDVLASGDHVQVKKLLTGKGKMTSDEVDNMLYGTYGKSENEVLSLFQERMEREDPIAYYGTKTAKSFDKITVQDAKENLENGNSPASEQYFALKDKLYDLYMQSGAYQEELVNKSIEGLGNEPKKATLKTVGLSRENGKTYTKSERVLLNKKIKDMSKGARMGYSAGRMDAKKKITDMFRKKLSIQKEKLTDKVNRVKWDARMKAQEIREIKKELVDYIEKNLPVYARSGFLNAVEKVENKKGLQKVFSRIDELVEKIEKKNKIKSIVNDIHKISKADNIAIDYKKEILEFSKLVDFKQRTKQAYEKMRRLKEYFMRSGKNTEEIPSRILDMIRLLERRNASELSMWELNIFHEKLLSLYQFGKTKLKLINSITEHEKERIKESLMNGTKRIDDVIIHKAKPGEKLTLKKQLKNVLLKSMFSAKQKGFAIMPMDAFFDLLDGLSNYSGANYTNFKKRIDLSFQKYLDYRDFVQSNVLNLGRSLGLSDRNYERIGVYAALKQEGGLDKLIATGVTKEEAESVVLDEKEMKMYKEMRKIFDEMLPRIKKFMRIVYNKDVQQVENYFSFMTDFEAMNDLEMQEKFGASPLSGDDNNGTRRTKTTKKDFTISRKGGTQTIKLNAMSIFLLHTDNVAYMLNMGRDIKILYEVANSQEYKAKAGTRGSVIVLDWLDTMARKGGMTGSQTLKWLDTLRKNVGVAVLGLKLSSALIQPTALLDGAAKIGRYAFYGATKLSDKKWRQFLMKNFQELRDRVGDDPALLEKTRGLMETIRRGAYSGIKFFDSLTASALTAGAYMKYMDDNGKTIDFENPDPKGVEYAQRMLRATQSSAFFKDVPQAISRGKITGNISLDKALFQFQNFMLTRWSLIRHDAIRYGINKKEYSKSIGIFSYIMLAAISSVGIRTVSGAIIAGLFGGGDDDNKENGFSLKVAKELLSTVPFVSQIVGAIMYQSNPVPIIQTAESIFSGAGSIVYGKKAETKQRGVIRTVIGASKLLGVPGMTQLEEFIRNQKESSISTSSSPIVKNGGVKKLTPKKIEIKNFE